MKILKSFSLLMCLCVALCFLLTPEAQSQWRIKIYAEDGSGWKDSLTLGVDPVATYGIDSATLGEYEEPPAGPNGQGQPPDFRSVQHYPEDLGTGVKLDLHPLTRPTQTDEWRLEVRRSDPEGNSITLSWVPESLPDPPGGFELYDGLGGVIFESVDMTAGGTFLHPDDDFGTKTVFIRSYDGYMMRTFSMDSLAIQRKEKGKDAKGKGLKRKGIASEWTFFIANTTSDTVNDLHVEYGQVIETHYSHTPFPTKSNPDSKGKKWDYTGASLLPGDTAVISGRGDKGKQIKIKYWWTKNGTQVGDKIAAGPSGIIRLGMPNPNNAIEEAYIQSPALNPDLGLTVGFDPKIVIHKKAKDIYKTLNKKGNLQDGQARCLDNFISGKPIEKAQKGLPPDKHDNAFLGCVLTLKVNVELSKKGKTPAGLGALVYSDTSSDYEGQTVDTILAKAERALACDSSALKGGGYKGLYDVLKRINEAFVCTLDTVSFGGGSKSPPPPTGGFGATVFTGCEGVGNVSFLYRPSGAIPPVADPVPFVDVASIPQAFSLRQNYPNPFNPTTTIEFTLPVDAFVTVKVYNMLGQQVMTLADREEFTEGLNEVEFDASELSSGVYFYRLVAQGYDDDGNVTQEQFTSVKKMMLVK